jgi:hypothetical protein
MINDEGIHFPSKSPLIPWQDIEEFESYYIRPSALSKGVQMIGIKLKTQSTFVSKLSWLRRFMTKLNGQFPFSFPVKDLDMPPTELIKLLQNRLHLNNSFAVETTGRIQKR